MKVKFYLFLVTKAHRHGRAAIKIHIMTFNRIRTDQRQLQGAHTPKELGVAAKPKQFPIVFGYPYIYHIFCI